MPFKLFFVSLLVCVVSFFQPAFAGGHGEANAFGFALVVPTEEVESVEKLLTSHRAFMENTATMVFFTSGEKQKLV